MTEPAREAEPGRLFVAPSGLVEVFDVDGMVDAVAAPAVMFRGRLRVARRLSFPEYHTKLVPLLHAIDRGGPEAARAVLAAFRLFYPRAWWQFWRPDIARHLCERLPAAELGRLLAGFLASDLDRQSGPTKTKPTSPSGAVARTRARPRGMPDVAVPFPTLSSSRARFGTGSGTSS